jgi:hypothetical protein
VGFELTIGQIRPTPTIFPRNWTRENIVEHSRTLCNLIMQHVKHSSSTRQTLLVLRILNLEPRNPYEQARLSLHENERQEAGSGNLPRVAQGRAQSPQWQAERGRCA